MTDKHYFYPKEQARTYMSENDYLALERLLGKLRAELGHQFALCCATHDSFHIGIYDNETGILKKELTTGSIEETVSKLKTKPITYDKNG